MSNPHSTTAPASHSGKHVQFDPVTKDWNCYLDGEYLGSRATRTAAEAHIDAVRFDQLRANVAAKH